MKQCVYLHEEMCLVCTHIYLLINIEISFSLMYLEDQSPEEGGPGPAKDFKVISFLLFFQFLFLTICTHGLYSQGCLMTATWPQESQPVFCLGQYLATLPMLASNSQSSFISFPNSWKSFPFKEHFKFALAEI